MIRLFARELDKGKGLWKPSPYYIALLLIRPLLDSPAESPPTGQDRLGNETEIAIDESEQSQGIVELTLTSTLT